jgi:FkbM family methyltransferase
MIPKFVRTLAERLSRNLVIPARLPKRFGARRIWLSPGNHLAVLKPGEAKFEGYLLGFAERFVDKGSVAWDIGANMAMFALPAAHRARYVLAIEPDPFNQLLLYKTIAANPDIKMEVLPAAIGNENSIVSFTIPVRGRSANHISQHDYGTQTDGTRQEYRVMMVTADWALDHFPAPDFIKVDAEGAEIWILEGGKRLLSEVRPVIVIEMPAINAQACADIFRANNYVMMSSYQRVDPANAIDDISDAWDVLAIPEEKLADMVGR